MLCIVSLNIPQIPLDMSGTVQTMTHISCKYNLSKQEIFVLSSHHQIQPFHLKKGQLSKPYLKNVGS